jgi:hypothetical protein
LIIILVLKKKSIIIKNINSEKGGDWYDGFNKITMG